MNEKLTFTDFCRVFEAYREYLKGVPAPAPAQTAPKSWADVYKLIEQGMQSPQPSVTDPAPKGIDDIITGLIK